MPALELRLYRRPANRRTAVRLMPFVSPVPSLHGTDLAAEYRELAIRRDELGESQRSSHMNTWIEVVCATFPDIP